MSVLDKIKAVNRKREVQLMERHTLVDESVELRLAYLKGLALACAIEREPAPAEWLAFGAIAASLDASPQEAKELFDERGNAGDEEIDALFVTLRSHNLGWLYLFDVAWIQAASERLEPNEVELFDDVAPMLGINAERATKLLRPLVEFIRTKNLVELVGIMPQLPNDMKFQKFIYEILIGRFFFIRSYGETKAG
ncbi:MAG TPA: hypothetical protein VJ001_17230 [Rhodocyclaceae bacterium]|nr:hypothetical protein [Rhodocyclaceae bacterium]